MPVQMPAVSSSRAIIIEFVNGNVASRVAEPICLLFGRVIGSRFGRLLNRRRDLSRYQPEPLAELGIERDFGLQHLGDGTIALRIARDDGELLLADSGDLGAQRQSRTTDLEALRPVWLERHGRFSCELGRIEAGRLQRERYGHCEAAGVSRRNELLRIGSLLVLKA